MIAAFTGTRKGMTRDQRDAARELIINSGASIVHNGAAPGSDCEIVESLIVAGWRAAAFCFWPCASHREAFVRGWLPGATFKPKAPPLDRNKAMVRASDLVIACPHGPEEQRSGTWSTVRYANKLGKRLIIVWPDGRVEA